MNSLDVGYLHKIEPDTISSGMVEGLMARHSSPVKGCNQSAETLNEPYRSMSHTQLNLGILLESIQAFSIWINL